jgi:phosphopantothenoylcysteine decarboxylase/phosphopantothenate--cysteine ligase
MLRDKNLDLVVYNDVSVSGIGFDSPDNEVTLLSSAGERRLPKASKDEIAAGIVDEVERLLEERSGGT